ncbi:hypothetical protein FIU87_00915 [Bacillus sp. THAF10]|uniref:hypothetical protein n=1 Tax=Bacillus sp. THAF10 TaxID=2587848 RepID=UPI001268BA7F|nr:hypothetical protein [Bacillus sp. THAF10]QFT87223.1 hypothetical protein FIU87_00915 [Bacillus sp. THAF10]
MNNKTYYRNNSSHDSKELTICNCCVKGLAKTILSRFRCGDTIGITFFGEESAGIFIGRFRGLENNVVEIDDLLVPGTTSFVPLCGIGSVEKGLPLQVEPLQISRKK